MARLLSVLAAACVLAGCGNQSAATSGAAQPTPNPANQSPAAVTPSARPLPTASFNSNITPTSTFGTPSVDLSALHLSGGPAHLLADYEAKKVDALMFTRWGLSLLGYLGDTVPARYNAAMISPQDAIALSTAVDQVSGLLPPDQLAAIQKDVQAFTHP